MQLPLAYFLLAFCVCLGALQASAAWSGYRGLLLIPGKRESYVLGGMVAAAALLWFILSGRAKVPGDVGGVEGAQQFTLFLVAAGAATGFSALAAGLTQARRPLEGEPPVGLEAFRHGTIIQVLAHRLGRRRSARKPAARP